MHKLSIPLFNFVFFSPFSGPKHLQTSGTHNNWRLEGGIGQMSTLQDKKHKKKKNKEQNNN